MNSRSFFSILVVTTTFLTTNTFAQDRVNLRLTTPSTEVHEQINGNELIKKMIWTKREFNKHRHAKSELQLIAPQHILNRSKPTIITFNGLDYLVQNNCVLEIKGLNLPEEVLIQLTEKLSFLDSVQFNYTEKINLAYLGKSTNQNIRNLDKWYLLTLRMLSSTVDDIAWITKKHDAASLAKNLYKMPSPNVNGTPAIAGSIAKLIK